MLLVGLLEVPVATSFDLHRLGWKAFEDLSACILSKVLGQTFQVFSDGADGGRDGAFCGEWRPNNGERLQGNFVVQCKHTSNPTASISGKVISDECEKAAALVNSGLCDVYILITNYSLSAGKVAEIESIFRSSGVDQVRVYGAEWVNKKIMEEPALRRMVPRLYGLGDLTQIITNQAYSQARSVLDGLLPDLKCFVPTEAYRRSAHALAEDRFVLLLGEPASGKTMIANLLAISAADQWNMQTVMLTNPHDFDRLWNPEDPGQFLWVDDAFGATQYDQSRVREWNHRLPKLKAALLGGSRVVFTSRDYIFRAAKWDLKISAFELFEDSRVVINVEELSSIERKMILYNHLKAGSQSKKFLKSIAPHLDAASEVPRFLPEVARRLARPKFTENLRATRLGVVDFFERPMAILEEVIQSVAVSQKAALGLVFVNGGRVKAPVPVDEFNVSFCESMGSAIGEAKAAFMSLDDSFLSSREDGGENYWKFRHPTIGDAFASVISKNPELIDTYLSGVSVERLMVEVTCGNIGLEGVKIVVPESMFPAVIKRLKEYKQRPNWVYFQNPIKSFLATRCSSAFLKLWFADESEMANLVASMYGFGAYDDSFVLLRKLGDAGILPVNVKSHVVNKIKQSAVNQKDLGFLRAGVLGNLMDEDEKMKLYREVVDITLSNVREIIDEIRADWDRQSEPDDCFYDISKTLRVIEDLGSAEEVEKVSEFRAEIDEEIQKMEMDREPSSELEQLEAEGAVQSIANSGRSVFDDLAD